MTKFVLQRFKCIKKSEIQWLRDSGDTLLADEMVRYNNEVSLLEKETYYTWDLIEQKKYKKLYMRANVFRLFKYTRKGELKSIVEYKRI